MPGSPNGPDDSQGALADADRVIAEARSAWRQLAEVDYHRVGHVERFALDLTGPERSQVVAGDTVRLVGDGVESAPRPRGDDRGLADWCDDDRAAVDYELVEPARGFASVPRPLRAVTDANEAPRAGLAPRSHAPATPPSPCDAARSECPSRSSWPAPPSAGWSLRPTGPATSER